MFLMTSLLRKRLFIGYFITGFIVISMVTAMINERCRLKELKNLIIQINEAYENSNKVHLYITLNPQLHSRSATYIKRNGLLIRKITIKSSRPFQCAYHPLTP